MEDSAFTAPPAATSLWRNRRFTTFWCAQSISTLGSVITRDALPLVAITVLTASPFQVALLAMAGSIPKLLVGLPAGAYADRVRRKPLLVVSDFARALLLLSIPAAAFLGELTFVHLVLVAMTAGIFTVLFDAADNAFLPALVEKDQLLESNSKIGMTNAVSEVGGAAVAGVLVQAFTAPVAILVDCFSFVFSGFAIMTISARETQVGPKSSLGALSAEIREGVRLVFSSEMLRPLALCNASLSLFGGFIGGLYALFTIRTLGFTPALLGALVATGGIGALIGAASATRIARRLGYARSTSLALLVFGLSTLVISAASGPLWLAAGMLIVQQVAGDAASSVFSVADVSLRQTTTPNDYLGRVNSAISVLSGSTNVCGLLIGGALAELVGIRLTLVCAGLGLILTAVIVDRSSLRNAPRAGTS